MYLKRLEIRNFRNHSQSTLEIGDAKFCVLRGSNFAGKSSIAQAISMLLTPSTDSLDAQGRGFAIKIKRGEAKAVITGDIQGKSKLVRRTVTLALNTTGRTDSSKCISDPDWHPGPFDKLLETNRVALGVALNTNAFQTMDEKAQKSLLAKLALPESYDFPEDVIAAVEKFLGEDAIDFTGDPFAVIEAAYKKLFAERGNINRDIKNFSIPEPIALAHGVSSASLNAKLAEAREARAKILREKDAAVKKESEGAVERTKLEGNIAKLEDKLTEQTTKLKEVEKSILSDAKHKEMLKVAGNKEKYDQFVEARKQIAVSLGEAKAEASRWASLSAAQAECESCGQAVTPQYVEGLKKHAAEKKAQLQKEDDEILQEMKGLGDVEGAGGALGKHDAAKVEQGTIQGIIMEKEKLHKDARAKLAAMGERPDAAAQFVQPIADADAVIEKLTNDLRPVIVAEEREKDIKAKTDELEVKVKRQTEIDGLVKYFDKDGIKADLLKEHIGAFEESLNDTMSAWQYKCSVSIEPYSFLVTDASGVTTPVSELSGSEQLLFSAALQCAVSRAAGIGIVVVDKMDTFLPSQRKKVTNCLYQAATSGVLDQVIILCSDENTEVAEVPSAKFFFVDSGTVAELSPA